MECYEENWCNFYINIYTDKSEYEQKNLKSYNFISNQDVNNIILSPPKYIELFPFEFIEPTYEIHIEQLTEDISLIKDKKI